MANSVMVISDIHISHAYTSAAVLNLLLFTEELITMLSNMTATASSPLRKSRLEIKKRMSTSPSY